MLFYFLRNISISNSLSLSISLFLSLSHYLCVCVYTCMYESKSYHRSEIGIRSLQLELDVVVSYDFWLLRIKFVSSTREDVHLTAKQILQAQVAIITRFVKPEILGLEEN